MNILSKSVITLFAMILGTALQGTWVDYTLALGMILIVGIPHGATDHVLSNWIKTSKIEERPTLKFLFTYVMMILGYGVLWYFFPSVSLLLFLLISAYHFGETQFQESEIHRGLKIIIQTTWGISVLSIILLSDTDYLSMLITPFLVEENMMQWVANHATTLLITPLLLNIGTIAVLGKKRLIKELIELGLIYCISTNTSLLFSFAVFFVCWHSRDAVLHQVNKLNIYSNLFNLKKWIRLSIPFSIIAVIGILILVMVFYSFRIEIPLVTVFFILVALITLPHVIVMSTFYQK